MNIFPFLISICVVTVCTAQLIVNVEDKIIEIDTSQWLPMDNEEAYADNFQEKQCDSTTFKYCRIVTIYKIPMSDDRKTGIKLSKSEYVDIMVVTPGFLTTQVRIDKGKYWVMSRETYQNLKSIESLKMYDAFPSQKKQKELLLEYQNYIDNTRYLLKSFF